MVTYSFNIRWFPISGCFPLSLSPATCSTLFACQKQRNCRCWVSSGSSPRPQQTSWRTLFIFLTGGAQLFDIKDQSFVDKMISIFYSDNKNLWNHGGHYQMMLYSTKNYHCVKLTQFYPQKQNKSKHMCVLVTVLYIHNFFCVEFDKSS